MNHQGVQASQRKGLTSGEVQELPGKSGKFTGRYGKIGGLVTRIAATSNPKSLATAIATQKITATPNAPVKLRLHCDFCGKSLRLRNCDWQLLAICDCDCVGH